MRPKKRENFICVCAFLLVCVKFALVIVIPLFQPLFNRRIDAQPLVDGGPAVLFGKRNYLGNDLLRIIYPGDNGPELMQQPNRWLGCHILHGLFLDFG